RMGPLWLCASVGRPKAASAAPAPSNWRRSMNIGERTRRVCGGVFAIGLSPAVARIFVPGPMVVSCLWFHSHADDKARTGTVRFCTVRPTDVQVGRSTVARVYFFMEQVLNPSRA